MEDFGQKPEIIHKRDGSPVTASDDAAEALILGALGALSPLPVVAEEAMHARPAPEFPEGASFWLVDALDGTREFISGGQNFSVNIALIERGQPTFGVIHAPAHGITWHAARGAGAHRIENGHTQRVRMREADAHNLAILGGVQSSAAVVLEPIIGAHKIGNRAQMSSSIKFCLLAQGQADLYPRLGRTYEWDTAAGDIILRESGGAVIALTDHLPLAYGKRAAGFANPGFVAGTRKSLRL